MSDAPAKLGPFARYLTLWVLLCIVVGVALGTWLPQPFQWLGRGGPPAPAGAGSGAGR